MQGKSVPLSVRLSQEDAAFIAGLSIQGAVTPSEKIRALIREARQKQAGTGSYTESLNFYQNLLAPTLEREREVEATRAMHSELLIQFSYWLPEVLAYVTANVPKMTEEDVVERLTTLEQGVADRIFQLFQQVLRLAVTGRSPCYDETVIASRVGPILELNELLKISMSKKGEGNDE